VCLAWLSWDTARAYYGIGLKPGVIVVDKDGITGRVIRKEGNKVIVVFDMPWGPWQGHMDLDTVRIQ
jgi:hypothetical protein